MVTRFRQQAEHCISVQYPPYSANSSGASDHLWCLSSLQRLEHAQAYKTLRFTQNGHHGPETAGVDDMQKSLRVGRWSRNDLTANLSAKVLL